MRGKDKNDTFNSGVNMEDEEDESGGKERDQADYDLLLGTAMMSSIHSDVFHGESPLIMLSLTRSYLYCLLGLCLCCMEMPRVFNAAWYGV